MRTAIYSFFSKISNAIKAVATYPPYKRIAAGLWAILPAAAIAYGIHGIYGPYMAATVTGAFVWIDCQLYYHRTAKVSA